MGKETKNRSTQKDSQYPDPPVTATPEDRKKLYILVLFAGIIIILLWIATWRWNYHHRDDSTVTPKDLFGAISEGLSGGSEITEFYEVFSDGINQAVPETDQENDTPVQQEPTTEQ